MIIELRIESAHLAAGVVAPKDVAACKAAGGRDCPAYQVGVVG
jgi:hypothetical protein